MLPTVTLIYPFSKSSHPVSLIHNVVPQIAQCSLSALGETRYVVKLPFESVIEIRLVRTWISVWKRAPLLLRQVSQWQWLPVIRPFGEMYSGLGFWNSSFVGARTV